MKILRDKFKDSIKQRIQFGYWMEIPTLDDTWRVEVIEKPAWLGASRTIGWKATPLERFQPQQSNPPREPGDYSWKFDGDCADMILGRPNPITGANRK